MPETRYMISDTAKQVEVETHVLRYWEDELELPIARNEMGHRYYTKENIRLFQNIKELKEQGFQLKAIKILIPELEKQEAGNMDNIIHLKEELNKRAMLEANRPDEKKEDGPADVQAAEIITAQSSDVVYTPDADEKMQQFQMIIGDIVTQVLKENNKALGEEISNHVGDHVIKEMDYLMRVKEEREEERYKLLDETIRTCQLSRRQVAAAKAVKQKKVKTKVKTKKPLFFRKKKKGQE